MSPSTVRFPMRCSLRAGVGALQPLSATEQHRRSRQNERPTSARNKPTYAQVAKKQRRLDPRSSPSASNSCRKPYHNRKSQNSLLSSGALWPASLPRRRRSHRFCGLRYPPVSFHLNWPDFSKAEKIAATSVAWLTASSLLLEPALARSRRTPLRTKKMGRILAIPIR